MIHVPVDKLAYFLSLLNFIPYFHTVGPKASRAAEGPNASQLDLIDSILRAYSDLT